MECLPSGGWFFSRAPTSGKPSSLWETFHQDTHTGMAYLYNVQTLLKLDPAIGSYTSSLTVSDPICFAQTSDSLGFTRRLYLQVSGQQVDIVICVWEKGTSLRTTPICIARDAYQKVATHILINPNAAGWLYLPIQTNAKKLEND